MYYIHAQILRWDGSLRPAQIPLRRTLLNKAGSGLRGLFCPQGPPKQDIEGFVLGLEISNPLTLSLLH